MKKVRISLRDSNKSWSFSLYESLSYFVYLHGHAKINDNHRQIISLKKGEFLEIEWIGADYYQIDPISLFLNEKKDTHRPKYNKCDQVRIGKSARRSGKNGFEYVTGYTGWVQGGIIPWSGKAASDVLKVIELKGRFKPRIDFSQLFEEVKDDPSADMLIAFSEDAGIC